MARVHGRQGGDGPWQWMTEAPPEVTPNGRPHKRVVVIAIDDVEYERRAVGCAQGEDHRADDRRGPDDLAAPVFTEHAKTAQNFKSDRHQRANVRSLVPLDNHLRFCSKP